MLERLVGAVRRWRGKDRGWKRLTRRGEPYGAIFQNDPRGAFFERGCRKTIRKVLILLNVAVVYASTFWYDMLKINRLQI